MDLRVNRAVGREKGCQPEQVAADVGMPNGEAPTPRGCLLGFRRAPRRSRTTTGSCSATPPLWSMSIPWIRPPASFSGASSTRRAPRATSSPCSGSCGTILKGSADTLTTDSHGGKAKKGKKKAKRTGIMLGLGREADVNQPADRPKKRPAKKTSRNGGGGPARSPRISAKSCRRASRPPRRSRPAAARRRRAPSSGSRPSR